MTEITERAAQVAKREKMKRKLKGFDDPKSAGSKELHNFADGYFMSSREGRMNNAGKIEMAHAGIRTRRAANKKAQIEKGENDEGVQEALNAEVAQLRQRTGQSTDSQN